MRGSLPACLLLCGCFAEAADVSPVATSDAMPTSGDPLGHSAEAGSGAPGDASDAGEVTESGADDSPGGGETTTAGFGTHGDESSTAADEEAAPIFDFFAEACGDNVVRTGYNEGPDGAGGLLDCGSPDEGQGVVEARRVQSTDNGPARAVVFFDIPDEPDASMGLRTAELLPLSAFAAPTFVAGLDCQPGDTTRVDWTVGLRETLQGPLDVQATGTHVCGEARAEIVVQFSNAFDRMVTFAVSKHDDAVALGVALVAPAVIDLQPR